MIRLLALLVAGTFAGFAVAPTERAPFHPHFPKTLEAKLPDGVTITIRYQTVTYDKKRAEKLPTGQAWHLAGAQFETSADITIGGQQVAAGNYTLRARKAKKGAWELVLDKGKQFSRKLSEDAVVLKTDFNGKAPLFEHLNIDIQPAGDKNHTSVYLDVRFDTQLARCKIELPE